jgi:hypothetical protein
MTKQANSLRKLFEVIKKNNKVVRYGDILRAGISAYVVDKLVEEYKAKLVIDNEGYTVITF